MWLAMLLLCSAPYSESCIVLTSEQLLESKEQCFQVSAQKARMALRDPQVYQAKPFCQKLPKTGREI
jgi:hypothetical protein